MTEERRSLEQRRDQALQDLVELERQVADRELSADVEVRLRRGYEEEAAAAIGELERFAEPAENEGVGGPAEAYRKPGRREPRWLLYGIGLLALVAAGALLPNYIADRPEGGFVSGNEALQQPDDTNGGSTGAAPSPGRDLDKVTDQELEAVVAANPDVLGMRLALAERYTEKGRYDLAIAHYGTVIKQDPGNPRATAGLGWLMLQLEEQEQANRLADEALAVNPKLPEALWTKANVRLYGFEDAKGAIEVLDTMLEQPELNPAVRGQAEELRQEAADTLADGSR